MCIWSDIENANLTCAKTVTYTIFLTLDIIISLSFDNYKMFCDIWALVKHPGLIFVRWINLCQKHVFNIYTETQLLLKLRFTLEIILSFVEVGDLLESLFHPKFGFHLENLHVFCLSLSDENGVSLLEIKRVIYVKRGLQIVLALLMRNRWNFRLTDRAKWTQKRFGLKLVKVVLKMLVFHFLGIKPI